MTNNVKFHSIKYQPCKKCKGSGTGGVSRRICYLIDRVEVICNFCGDTTTIMKEKKVREKIEQNIARIIEEAKELYRKAAKRPYRASSAVLRNVKSGSTRQTARKNNRSKKHEKSR